MEGNSRYKIEEEIARGGMGVVLRVKDGDLDRTLAMKRMASAPDETLGGAEAARFARFMEEAQVTAQLDHPSIVPVHDLGFDDDGKVWYTMKLVEGRELGALFDAARASEDGWNEAGVLRLFVKICDALAYAHEKGVIHRDLKPANVMVGEFGEVYVMDWGLARVTGSEFGGEVTSPREDDQISGGGMTTLDGSVMGTPEFMAPEQANGEGVDMRSDIYAVGAMLYYFLAGRLPYEGNSEEVLELVRTENPAPLPSGVKRELVTICERAMAREPGDRYGTMRELGDDLNRFLDGRVVVAHEQGKWAEFRKLVLRNRGVSAALFGVFALLLTMLFIQGKAKNQISKSEESAVAALERMAVERGFNRGKDLDYGEAAYWFSKAEGWASQLGREEQAKTHRVRSRVAEERQTTPMGAVMVPFLQPGHCRLDFSPDGRWLVVTHYSRGEIKQVVDVEGECLLESADGGLFFEAVAFCQKTGRVAVVPEGKGRSCEVFLPSEMNEKREVVFLADGKSKIGALAFSPDGETLFFGADRGFFYHLRRKEFEETVLAHGLHDRIALAQYDPAGKRVMTVTKRQPARGDFSSLRIFEVSGEGQALYPARDHWFWPNLMQPQFVRQGREFVYVQKPGVWARAGTASGKVLEQKNEVPCDFRDEDLAQIHWGGDNGNKGVFRQIDESVGNAKFCGSRPSILANRPWLRELSLLDGRVIRPVGLNRYEVVAVAVTRDGNLAAAWETDGLLRFWSLNETEWQFETGLKGEAVFSASGEWIVGSAGVSLRVQEVKTKRAIGAKMVFDAEVLDTHFCSDEKVLAVALRGGILQFWDWREGVVLKSFKGFPSDIICIEDSPRTGKFAAICHGGELVELDVESGEVEVLLKHDKMRSSAPAPLSIRGISYSESGRWLMAWSSCEGVLIWDCEQGVQAPSPPVKDGRYISLLKVRGERLLFLEVGEYEQEFWVHEWGLEEAKWTMELLDAGRGLYCNLDVSKDGSQVLLSRTGEQYASLAERGEDGQWEWRKVLSLGRGASFFVPDTPFAVGVTATGPSRFVLVDLRDDSFLAAPLTNKVSRFHYPLLSPNGDQMAAVDWSSKGVAQVWDFSVLKAEEGVSLEAEDRMALSELLVGGRDGEFGWEELKGEAWLSKWREFRKKYPKLRFF